MKNLLTLGVLTITVFLYACKKDVRVKPLDEIQSTPTIYPNYSNFKVGNYWIYERFEIDGNGNVTSLNIIDSCYIEKDTIIRGNKYYKYMQPGFSYPNMYNVKGPVSSSFLRDSLSYITTYYGEIMFSSKDFTTEFANHYDIGSDTIYHAIQKMDDKDLMYTTPAGTFKTSSMKCKYIMWPNYSGAGAIRDVDTRYTENIGKVVEEWVFFSNIPTTWERRLIRYHLN